MSSATGGPALADQTVRAFRMLHPWSATADGAYHVMYMYTYISPNCTQVAPPGVCSVHSRCVQCRTWPNSAPSGGSCLHNKPMVLSSSIASFSRLSSPSAVIVVTTIRWTTVDKSKCFCTDSKVGWGKAPIRGDPPTRPVYITTAQIATKVFISVLPHSV